jgi:hypothetical protein
MQKKEKWSPAKTRLTMRGLLRYFRRRITKNATTNSPATAYNASKPGKPRNPPAADAVADAVGFAVAFAGGIITLSMT